MSTNKEVYLSGTCKWAKLNKKNYDKKYSCYVMDFYPTAESFELFKELELELKVREDEDGTFVKLRRDSVRVNKNSKEITEVDPPLLLDHDNNPMDQETLIGNGSKVTVKIDTFPTAKGNGHRLVAVRVDELVVYDEPEVLHSKDTVPF